MVDLVCNGVHVDRVDPTLERLAKNPNQAEIMDLFTHEQYFWPFYFTIFPIMPSGSRPRFGGLPNDGYQPVFFHEGFLGGRV